MRQRLDRVKLMSAVRVAGGLRGGGGGRLGILVLLVELGQHGLFLLGLGEHEPDEHRPERHGDDGDAVGPVLSLDKGLLGRWDGL